MGPAGLSGALALTRFRRTVLVVDSGEPRNAPAAQIHDYLGREGTPPGELLAAGRAEVAGYGGEVVTGTVTTAERLVDDRKDGARFRVAVAGGRAVLGRRLLVTTGLADELPDVPGVAQRRGTGCAALPVLHQALLFRQLSDHVTLLQHTASELGEEA